jgi:hypothetical protein
VEATIEESEGRRIALRALARAEDGTLLAEGHGTFVRPLGSAEAC